ncbi:MAG: NADH-ubiquinone oxidoreductase-F iron-sulfur binding region domain-containing protein [Candidatus Ranarchaeia archaeon]
MSESGQYTVTVYKGSCGIAAGAIKVYSSFEKKISEKNIDTKLRQVSCIGMCHSEVLVTIEKKDEKPITYRFIDSRKVDRIIEEHLIGNKVIEDWVISKGPLNESKAYGKQVRIELENIGLIDPESIEEYMEHEGYLALKKVLSNMSPKEVIDLIKEAGLRGRGGAGFPTGLKWELSAREESNTKYIICNADEGDPGAFMNRSILEGDPHRIIEGMIIAGYATGSSHGIIYCRKEYPLALLMMEKAIKDSTEKGFLGENILDSDFSFSVKIKEGAGAFVCGEETALIASIEGKRGMPIARPPYPSQKGLWGKPTTINNVGTLSNVQWIIRKGSKEFRKYGTEKSPGTKAFSLAGKIKKGGLIEVPFGTTIYEVIMEIGGGILDDKKFKAVQLGGPSGGCVPSSLAHIPITYEDLPPTGAIVGSGGMVVMDEDTCMVDVARFFLDFIQAESCGKCTYCRIGTKRMLEILERITKGHGKMEDIEILEELSTKIKSNSLCGLGQTAPNPVLTTLRYFKEEYVDHIQDKKCKSKVCLDLLTFSVNLENCTKCNLCVTNCPVDAIVMTEEGAVIDNKKCIKCGRCRSVCKFDAVIAE